MYGKKLMLKLIFKHIGYGAWLINHVKHNKKNLKT